MYLWKADYYGGRIARLDFSQGTDTYLDPGFSPGSFWAIEQPMGSHLIYAAILRLAGAEPPSLQEPVIEAPTSARATRIWLPITEIPPSTLRITRSAAVLCAATGAALLSLHFSWAGAVAILLLLLIPHARADLARAWAEGPLLLGFGLCAVSYGSRWFAPVAGIAATLKLTVLGLWPLVFWRGFGKSRFAHTLAVGVAAVVWSVLTPPSWFMGGPLYLAIQVIYRFNVYASQSADVGGPGGFFIQTRYLWPLELGLLILFSHLVIEHLPTLLEVAWHLYKRGRRVLTKGRFGDRVNYHAHDNHKH